MKIYIKQLYDESKNKIPINVPKKGTELSAGYDIIATTDPKIVGVSYGDCCEKEDKDDIKWKSVSYIEYETNLYIAPSVLTVHTLIHPRSSISKYNLVLANSIGLVDNDYRGMLLCRFKYIWQPEDFVEKYSMVPIADGSDVCLNQTTGRFLGKINKEKIYKKGDAIAQLIVEPTISIEWELVDDLSQTSRGEGGFGHTDKNQSKKSESSISSNLSPLMDKYYKIYDSNKGNVGENKLTYEQFVKEKEKQI